MPSPLVHHQVVNSESVANQPPGPNFEPEQHCQRRGLLELKSLPLTVPLTLKASATVASSCWLP
eukprot:3054587-Rhodomonas_salina.2